MPAPFQLGTTGVMGFILVCTRCGIAINAYPTNEAYQDLRRQQMGDTGFAADEPTGENAQA
jgi:hypothetical protein